jgi:hypothetical protein
MSVLTAAGLLASWEQTRSLPAVQRSAALLRAFGLSDQESVGRQDAALLQAYAENFGPRLDGLARCPQCATDVELSIPIDELTAGLPPAQPIGPLFVGGHTVHWRLPDDTDLAAAANCPDLEHGALVLLARCVVQADRASAELPVPVREQLAERIAAADPYADMSVELVCPACGAQWDSPLGIGEFVSVQLQWRARRLLREVDELARAYGWNEEQILALSQERRDAYLESVRHG